MNFYQLQSFAYDIEEHQNEWKTIKFGNGAVLADVDHVSKICVFDFLRNRGVFVEFRYPVQEMNDHRQAERAKPFSDVRPGPEAILEANCFKYIFFKCV